MPVRYSQLDYQRVIVVHGAERLSDIAGSFTIAANADLVVAVKGNRIRVVKDRFGVDGEISKAQFEDIKALDPEVVDAKGRVTGS